MNNNNMASRLNNNDNYTSITMNSNNTQDKEKRSQKEEVPQEKATPPSIFQKKLPRSERRFELCFCHTNLQFLSIIEFYGIEFEFWVCYRLWKK